MTTNFRFGKIGGLFVRDLLVNVDDRGVLVELMRNDWPENMVGLSNYITLKQIYLVANKTLAIRAFHKHGRLVDYFCIIQGNAKFIFVDDRTNSETFENMQIVNVTDQRLQLITVPTGVFHGWKADIGTILISGANQLYMGIDKKGELDEVRIPWDTYGVGIWETFNK
jgi:dTDP-4-dehydrorhamnose 3,5-epimerase-like enzyme